MRLITPSHTTSRSQAVHHMQSPSLSYTWMPVLIGLLVITIESTRVMGASHTSQWLLSICSKLWGQADTARFEMVHFFLRKTGHFTGYGLLAIFFAKAWTSTLRIAFAMRMRRRTRLLLGTVAGILSAATIASIDEIHQLSLPGRTGTFHDVVIDTCGATIFATTLYFMAKRRRRAALVAANAAA